ncbi:MAG: hypothetical protein ACHQRJ_02520 [Alphaproteobacteria bacterium]
MVSEAASTALAEPEEVAPPIRLANLIWVALALLVMLAAIESERHWFLNFVHVLAGVLWTGIDLFMGFVVGPILRRLPLAARRAVVCRLMPRILFILPTLAVITGTAGWFLAERGGYLALAYPAFWWVASALALIAVLTVQGLGILLPLNLRVYFELRKPRPDGNRIARMMRLYVRVVALQGLMQIAIILVMARFVTGL